MLPQTTAAVTRSKKRKTRGRWCDGTLLIHFATLVHRQCICGQLALGHRSKWTSAERLNSPSKWLSWSKAVSQRGKLHIRWVSYVFVDEATVWMCIWIECCSRIVFSGALLSKYDSCCFLWKLAPFGSRQRKRTSFGRALIHGAMVAAPNGIVHHQCCSGPASVTGGDRLPSWWCAHHISPSARTVARTRPTESLVKDAPENS